MVFMVAGALYTYYQHQQKRQQSATAAAAAAGAAVNISSTSSEGAIEPNHKDDDKTVAVDSSQVTTGTAATATSPTDTTTATDLNRTSSSSSSHSNSVYTSLQHDRNNDLHRRVSALTASARQSGSQLYRTALVRLQKSSSNSNNNPNMSNDHHHPAGGLPPLPSSLPRNGVIVNLYSPRPSDPSSTREGDDDEADDDEHDDDVTFLHAAADDLLPNQHYDHIGNSTNNHDHKMEHEVPRTAPYHVRQEWIDAVFGPDFVTTEQQQHQPLQPPKQQGVGAAGIPWYYTDTVDIPIPEQVDLQTDKLGLTLHRLALGLYVRAVLAGSEAALAGILPDSVLVDVNGMAFLAEPSKQALERLWLYEGLFVDKTENNNMSSSVSFPSAEWPNIIREAANQPNAATISPAQFWAADDNAGAHPTTFLSERSNPLHCNLATANADPSSAIMTGCTIPVAAVPDSSSPVATASPAVSSPRFAANSNTNLTAEPNHIPAQTHNAATTLPNGNNSHWGNGSNLVCQHPVALTLIKDGRLYTSLLLSTAGGSSSSSWGISWASVGNFALIKRVYSWAATAGVHRGSLLAAIIAPNQQQQQIPPTMRHLDHAETALALRSALEHIVTSSSSFDVAAAEDPTNTTTSTTISSLAHRAAVSEKQRFISVVLAFPPAAARTGHYERMHGWDRHVMFAPLGNAAAGASVSHHGAATSAGTAVPTAKHQQLQPWVTKTRDGVQVKFYPLEYRTLVSTLCQSSSIHTTATSQHQPQPSIAQSSGDGLSASGNLHQWAERVSAGFAEAPTRRITPSRRSREWMSPATTPSTTSRHPRLYGPCPSLDKDRMFQVWDPLEALVYCLQMHRCRYHETEFMARFKPNATASAQDHLESLRYLTAGPEAAQIVSAFLLQFLSLICSPPLTHQPANASHQDDGDEKKESHPSYVSHVSTHFPSSLAVRKTASDLTSMLLKLSRRDEGFCQRLYFLLRSYISTFETRRPGPTPSAGEESNSCNLMALLHCLELLRFAEKQLARRSYGSLPNTPSRSMSYEITPPPPLTTSGYPRRGSWTEAMFEDEEKAEPSSTTTIQIIEPSPAPSLLAASPGTPHSNGIDSTPPRRTGGIINMFRKKKGSITRQFSHTRLIPCGGGSPPLHQDASAAMVSASPSSPSRSLTPPRARSTRSVDSSLPTAANISRDSRVSAASLSQTPSAMYENMSDFLSELDRICGTIERSLQKSFRQKIAEWAMQPWSASKDSALANVTENMRECLRQANENPERTMLLVNPIESSELLSSVDCDECYILPSAHFPILLTFNVSERRCSDSGFADERLFRTQVDLESLEGLLPVSNSNNLSFIVHGAVAGSIRESGAGGYIGSSIYYDQNGGPVPVHTWQSGNKLVFETRSTWGPPKTLSLRISVDAGNSKKGEVVGYAWIDLSRSWHHLDDDDRFVTSRCITTKERADVWPLVAFEGRFDDHGDLGESVQSHPCHLALKCNVTLGIIDLDGDDNGNLGRKRMLLYKHDDDLRQEAFAVQFIQRCDEMLKASGLDMKLLTFQCIPVGVKRGFVEWIPGSVPLSEICQPFAGSIFGANSSNNNSSTTRRGTSEQPAGAAPSMFAKAGLNKYESLFRLGGEQHESVRQSSVGASGTDNNSIQYFLRSVAYDPDGPYWIRRDVMDIYVKGCAAWSVITYVLGVGDRHLDNLLLHQSGCLFHCDYSFILGSDPKAYLPMRITEDMINGMGGKQSDNYAKFLSYMSAAFLTLRRSESVRVLLSMVRLLEASWLPDVSENQRIESAIFGLRDRLRLDLNEEMAVTYMENLVETSLANKLWLAVDAIHSLGKKF